MTGTRWEAAAAAAGDAARPSRAPRLARFLFLGSLVAALLVIAIAAITLWQARQDSWGYADRSADNLRQGVIGYIDQHMRLYALALELATQALSDPKFGALPDQARQEILTDIAQSTAYVSSIMELDAEGRVVRSSVQLPGEVDFADQEYFTAQRDDPDRGIHVSQPTHGRAGGGDPVIALSRRLSHPDGGFAGVVVIAVRLAYIEAFLATLDMGPQGALLLLSSDGRILARQPPGAVQAAVGTDLSHTAIFRRVREAGSGAFVATVDGIERFFVFARVPRQPLIVNVALATQDIFAAWWRRTIVIGAVTLVTCAIIVLLAVLLRRELRRRAVVEADLARLSTTDALTGLANRRRYDEVIAREWRRTRRMGAPLALLLLDVDDFKKLNDGHGHALGDEVLKALAATINACIRRPGDLGARYGGEEFAVILPDTDGDGAMLIAEKIRAACEALDTGLPRITVSIGVKAVRPASCPSIEWFQAEADKALYQAKAFGRNRVVLAA